jgi:Flp pilus assembly protein TadG
MAVFKKIRRFFRDEKGAMMVLFAVLLPAIGGMVGMAVDMGVVYSAKGELQNAADSAALAGANTMMTIDADNNPVMAISTGIASAQQYSLTNQALGQSLMLRQEDITVGKWDPETKSFAITSPSNPSELNAMQVTVRRDNVANSPVSTFFSKLLGINEVNVSATSVAFLGHAGKIPPTLVDLPIAVNKDALNEGDGPVCDDCLDFHSGHTENAEWTTFFKETCDVQCVVYKYIKGQYQSPELEVGDIINVVEGNLSNWIFYWVYQRFQYEGQDTDGDGFADEWTVVLPVVDYAPSSTKSTIVGFCHFTITEVRLAPYKDLKGTLECNMILPGTQTGGEDFGTRASLSKLSQ